MHSEAEQEARGMRTEIARIGPSREMNGEVTFGLAAIRVKAVGYGAMYSI